MLKILELKFKDLTKNLKGKKYGEIEYIVKRQY